jgi:hypothetical protein
MLIVFMVGVILAIVIMWGLVISTVFKGNFWFSEDSVLRELRVDRTEAVRVLKTERNVYSDSVITVENKDGSRADYCLDSDVLWNYSLSTCKK